MRPVATGIVARLQVVTASAAADSCLVERDEPLTGGLPLHALEWVDVHLLGEVAAALHGPAGKA